MLPAPFTSTKNLKTNPKQKHTPKNSQTEVVKPKNTHYYYKQEKTITPQTGEHTKTNRHSPVRKH
jgi:hypothetical protein